MDFSAGVQLQVHPVVGASVTLLLVVALLLQACGDRLITTTLRAYLAAARWRASNVEYVGDSLEDIVDGFWHRYSELQSRSWPRFVTVVRALWWLRSELLPGTIRAHVKAAEAAATTSTATRSEPRDTAKYVVKFVPKPRGASIRRNEGPEVFVEEEAFIKMLGMQFNEFEHAFDEHAAESRRTKSRRTIVTPH